MRFSHSGTQRLTAVIVAKRNDDFEEQRLQLFQLELVVK